MAEHAVMRLSERTFELDRQIEEHVKACGVCSAAGYRPPLKLIPKSKPSKEGFKPGSRFIVSLAAAIFWVGFFAGWLARGA